MTEVRVFFGGREVERERIAAWEMKRALKVARKLGVEVGEAPLSVVRETLAARKIELGGEYFRRRLKNEVAVSTRFAETATRLWGARRLCRIVVAADGGSAERFVDWFHERIADDDAAALIGACPDHYVLGPLRDGRQEIIETNGGSPVAARFFIDYGDFSSLTSTVRPEFPYRLAGVAKTYDGVHIGGINHAFRDRAAGGFLSELTVEFPRLVIPTVVSGHRWHLACEFSNWIRAAAASL